MTSVGDPVIGQLVDDRYQITRRLARGGMATVYCAVDTRLTRTVACKVMHVGLGDDAEFARKFDREARSAARLSHPNVVSVFDQGQDSGRPYIVMEYVDGHTLRDVINNEAPLAPLRALEVLEPVLAALACAHDAGLVHRDVKPENVLISQRGQIKVADFGLAKAITSQTSTATQGLLIGTVSYLPPELVVSGRADARSDVYSAGVVLFELLTGRKPHTGETPIQVAYAHVHTDVPPPSSLPTAGPVPPYLDALVRRATARDPALRPHDARVFLTQLRRVRAALRDGLADDPELTQDLTGIRRGSPASPDPTDSELTQQVPSGPGSPGYPGNPAPTNTAPTKHPSTQRFGHRHPRSAPHGRAVAPGAPSSPPTVRDAAPAGPPQHQIRQLSAERMAAERERAARRRRRGVLILLLVLMLTTVAALTGWYLTDGRFTRAPALTSLPQGEATEVAEMAGLQVETSGEFSEGVTKGVVITTEPSAGTKIVDGGTMTLVVSRGPERYEMPKVVGLDLAAARAALAEANLDVGSVTETYHEKVAKNIVLSASEQPGTELRRDWNVALTVSQGPKPITITDYTGKSAAEATTALSKAGLTVQSSSAHSASVPTGQVIKQSPAGGTGTKGDTVALKTSLGPVMVTIPNVRSMGVKAATKVMRDKGFDVVVRPVAVNYIGVGFVVLSRPGAGKEAPKGSTITLFVV